MRERKRAAGRSAARAAAPGAAETVALVGMDAHSEKIALCVTRWRHGSDPEIQKEIVTTLDALEATYARQVPPGALTVLEASTNAFSIRGRLAAAGRDAKVLASDTLAGRARADRVNDRIDARNLALAYARGGTREVHAPSPQHAQWRDLFFGHRNAVKDCTRHSNRLWAFCCGHGLRLPKKSFRRKIESVRRDVPARGWTPDEMFHLERLPGEYAHALTTRAAYRQRIESVVAGDADMARLTQIPGVRFITAFALAAFIGDVKRFKNPKKLAGYIGLNPSVASSGKRDGARSLSRYGRSDLKALMVEAAQSAMRRGGGGAAARWARRKAASGKHRNVAVCALARKLAVRAWHILMGHPAPDRECEKPFRLKLAKLAAAAGRERLAALGFKRPADFIEDACRQVYPPPAPPELRGTAPASA